MFYFVEVLIYSKCVKFITFFVNVLNTKGNFKHNKRVIFVFFSGIVKHFKNAIFCERRMARGANVYTNYGTVFQV